MKVLLAHPSLGVGGVETMIVRMIKWLADRGHEVTLPILEVGDRELLDQVSAYAEVDLISPIEAASMFFPFVLSTKYRSRHFDVIHTFDRVSLVATAQFGKRSTSRFCVGVYHPNSFAPTPETPSFSSYPASREIFGQIPDENIVFMNGVCRDSHRSFYDSGYDGSAVIPLPVLRPETRPKREVSRSPDRIVSVGRLVDFKCYHFGVVDAIAMLKAHGHAIQYDIYGRGPLESQIRAHATELGCEDLVTLKGNVPYSQLAQEMATATVFVGMGTSLLEAAMAGIPSIAMQLWNRKGEHSGFFHEQEEFALGEKSDDRALLPTLKQVLNLDHEDYEQLCLQEYKATDPFKMDSVMNQYVSVWEHATRLNPETYIPSATITILKRVVRGPKVRTWLEKKKPSFR